MFTRFRYGLAACDAPWLTDGLAVARKRFSGGGGAPHAFFRSGGLCMRRERLGEVSAVADPVCAVRYWRACIDGTSATQSGATRDESPAGARGIGPSCGTSFNGTCISSSNTCISSSGTCLTTLRFRYSSWCYRRSPVVAWSLLGARYSGGAIWPIQFANFSGTA
jgi:hypothetical protein